MLASDYRNGTWCSEEFICSIIHPSDLLTSSKILTYGVNPMIQVYPVSASVIPNVHRSCPRLHLFANLSKERKSVMIHTAIAWNVNRMAYIERGYKKTWKEERSENAHIRWRRSRTKQSTQRSGLVQLSIVGSTATLLCSQTCAQKLLHTIRT